MTVQLPGRNVPLQVAYIAIIVESGVHNDDAALAIDNLH